VYISRLEVAAGGHISAGTEATTEPLPGRAPAAARRVAREVFAIRWWKSPAPFSIPCCDRYPGTEVSTRSEATTWHDADIR
jgi:hypothetical protein